MIISHGDSIFLRDLNRANKICLLKCLVCGQVKYVALLQRYYLRFFSRTVGEIAIYAGLPGLLIPLIAGAHKVLEAIRRSDTGNFSKFMSETWSKRIIKRQQ